MPTGRKGDYAMIETDVMVYCAKDNCDNEADQVLLTNGAATPFCQNCINTAEYVAALVCQNLDLWTVPVKDYFAEHGEEDYEEHWQLGMARAEMEEQE